MKTTAINPHVLFAAEAAERLGPLLETLRVKRLCLHGSRTKGTALPGSDWDFQIDLSGPLSRDEVQLLKTALGRLLSGKIEFHAPGFTDAAFIAAIQPYCVEVWPHPESK